MMSANSPMAASTITAQLHFHSNESNRLPALELFARWALALDAALLLFPHKKQLQMLQCYC